ncbi:NAD-dependent epimerase/dehydratase [Lentisphaera araneosa HTCC2155]|uniref:NAD-dependent epimerase/dehydratase n=1 Tax=Lentisphaera araneosa HTCC2155 TaxID=313628 RepID=A6DHG3_9BACT|nr:SDR family oxidoreductase [Lentisphaera araneosa]EDM29046.1 NAD-dependent epimerase/dehydratase [Lentisphaera araneosa HTCC2155]
MKRTIENSHVLVTGGAGFIGSNLVDVLLKQNNRVRVLDDFSTGKEKNLSHLYDFENQRPIANNFELIRGDIRKQDHCHQACEDIDYVLHQAALGSVPRSLKDPVTTDEVNNGGFLKMLVAARDAKVKRFIYAASSSTYGDHPRLPKVEHTIGKPLSPYAITKYTNELYADVFYKSYGLETIGLRYFNVFGRRQTPDGAYAAVIPTFVSALINGESITINGDGLTSRDFTYIDNIIQLNQLASLTTNPDAINQVFNAACGGNETLNSLFETLRHLLAKFNPQIAQAKVFYGPERTGDIKHSKADISKAQKLLNYSPSHDFNQGIQASVDWYWNNLKTNN